ncbi:MAG TPA: Uma2 family endonuclease [Thermoanaerobaculia bacterium]
MDEKRPGLSLKAPAGSGGAFHLPGRGSFPPVDDHLVEPEVTRDEIINGRRVVAMPAEAPHGDQQVDLDTLLRIHAAPGFVVSADLITRFAETSDFASDTCVRRKGTDRATGRRYLEEIAFEVVSTQTEQKAMEKAEVMHRRGVRRIFGIWVKSRRRRVCEWSAASGSWRLLEEGSQIADPCLATPLPVKALLDAAVVRRAVVQALESQGEPAIQELKAAAEARGEARGVARSILAILEARGIAASPVQREEILGCTDLERLDRWLLRAGVATSAGEIMAVD